MNKENYKRIPGFSRYLINEEGTVINDLTKVELKAEQHYNRTRFSLTNDLGKREKFYPADHLDEIFKVEEVVVDEDPYLKETVAPVIQASPEVVIDPSIKIRTPKKFDFKSMNAEEKRSVHAANKVSVADVIEIRRAYDAKELTKKQIAAKYGIGWQTAGKICNRRIYKNVPEQPKIETTA